MKLVHKLAIGIAVSSAIAATAIALGITFGGNGLDIKDSVRGVIYKTEQVEKIEDNKQSPKPDNTEKEDQKVPEIKAPEVIQDPKEQPKPEKPKEEIKESEPDPAPEPVPQPAPEPAPAPAPEPEPQKDETLKPNAPEDPVEPLKLPPVEEKESEAITDLGGIKVRYKQQQQPNREIYKSWEKAGIANPNGADWYKAVIVPEVLGLEFTEAVRKASVDNVKKGLSTYHFPQSLKNSVKQLKDEELQAFANNNPDHWKQVFERWKPLFDNGDKVLDFLTDEGKQKYPEIKKLSGAPKYLRLLQYLDMSKFTELTAEAEKNIKEGFIIDPRNLYVDENGRLSSNTYSPLPGHNKVTSRLERDNEQYRTFGHKTPFNRPPSSVGTGDYYGWKKSYVTTQYSKYGADERHGVSFLKYEREQKSDKYRNEGIVLEINFANKEGYQKSVKLLQELKRDKVEITGYRFKNMGSSDSNQRFKQILSELPDKIQMLELFFETTNTSALLALENKKISELSLYTSINPLLEDWSFNPYAVRNTTWINTNDYNVSKDFATGVKKYSRIVFDSIAFDQSDILKDRTEWEDKMERINWGLQMVYTVRNNEPFFQGAMGQGNRPDHNEKGNSYPIGLDLSRTKLTSLRGLLFEDVKKKNGLRKLIRLKLFNDKSTFAIDVEDLNKAQFNYVLEIPGSMYPPTKITFSNGKQTTSIRVTSKKDLEIDSNGVENLRILRDYGKESFTDKTATKIYVDPKLSKLAKQLKASGFNVIEQSEGDALDIT
ncbi:putative immunoglobulin-blocking virulence protein [Ureaplasma diversum]|uniref:putative immunoglobulin-blocking virulence protein n=1 Tax=Ureaplasma diversum TaxID=42094 RepID=UPI000B25B68F|nr:putative immunoglobulin-blocking virulence protein [Ureaplasma diversum]